MNVILLLIPLSLVLLAAGVCAFFWAIDHAQFDDLETPALMPLTDDREGSSEQVCVDARPADDQH
jgi:cbb3-type cytochrome oxidase maturation protein